MNATTHDFDAVVQLAGGLGNQLFQYAFGMHLRAVHGLRVGYDIEFYKRPSNVAHNRLHLIEFGFDVPLDTNPAAIYRTVRRLKWLPSSLQNAVFGLTYTKCPSDRYRPVSVTRGLDYFTGLWQSPKYFEAIQDEVRRDFRARLLAASDRQFERRDGVVGMHIRRGDYLTHAPAYNLDYVAYMTAALKMLATTTGRSDWPVLVYSDDPEWCAANLPLGDIEIVASETMLDDFLGFMSCEHKIISNSTFAWWAAFLGESGAVTLAPNRWHAHADLAQTQILMPDWQVVDC